MKNIIKRILVGVAVGTILMLIRSNVFAESIQANYIYTYDGTANSRYTGSNINMQTINALTYYGPIVPANRQFDSVRFRFQNKNLAPDNSLRQISFVGESGVGIPTVFIQNGSSLFGCYVNPDIYNDTDAYNVENVYVGFSFNVICPNVNLYGSDISIWYKYGSMNFTSANSSILVSAQLSISLMSDTATVVEAITDTNSAVNDVNDSINSSTTPSSSDTNNAYSNFEGATAQNGVITSLVTLPVSLFTNILSALNSSCTRFDMGTLLGTHIYFNCINPANYLGSQLWSVIDILMSGFFVWYISRKLIKVFENLSSLKEGDPVGD